MDKPKKEPIALHRRQDNKLCLNCGFPNRPSDTRCMYCSTSLVNDQGIISWIRQTYYILRWRWQLKNKRDSLERNHSKKLIQFLGFFMVGVILSLAGAYFFYASLEENSFSNALIAVLLLLYGFFTFKSLFSSK
ncbi:MAG: hypothetical protein GWM98_24305 [Nitrospinaceae bacterium]|nr:hypothetical protein [Nitrospinaceae bacterium]NIR57013.1 hypothetical protein [Nitrospinaceae bacterium]NIS85938.1 hypothetical protein [Nitrospinaceae bacterium]NIT84319.1 hypothetical protein [Nitrospinaceae bacterium]NIU46509.1 hypothetical protein [Nitrospinaceae bacterium]